MIAIFAGPQSAAFSMSRGKLVLLRKACEIRLHVVASRRRARNTSCLMLVRSATYPLLRPF
jgi:hypothetical protein